ncbi:hypothetical protein CY35_04G105800 [Sphagnum magellanicum]|nr:hypothetical protein CY35_04G105800 [Sphagnum magellanicum]KAH9565951.1 hypothetical protein CY35_04G105800 [Sphagnum magellanicum]
MIIMTPNSAGSGEQHQTGGGGGGGSSEGSFQWSSVAPVGSTGTPIQDDALEGTKVRKPYTITKQRERWTGEEHQKFLEALKLYGRAWRRIEEHIGTKTAVQIRSHAQKFFSKVERDQTVPPGGGVVGMDTGGMVQPLIDIPPPRPKRKPSHPYPRKAKGNNNNVSKHSVEDDTPIPSSSSGSLATARPAEDGLVKSSTRQEDDVTEVHNLESSPDAHPKEEISGEEKLTAVGPPIQVLSDPSSWVPFPAFHHYPQWGNYFPNQHIPNCNEQPGGSYGNFEKMAQLAALFMSRGLMLPWHPSQVTLTSSCGPQDRSAVPEALSAMSGFWPAIDSGTTTITASGIPEFGSHNSCRGTSSVPEDEAAKAAMAAAASAWWALQNGGASPLSLAAMRALYNPGMATMPSPFLFSQGKLFQPDAAKLQGPEPEGEVAPIHTQQAPPEDSSQELVVHSGGHQLVRSDAVQMAERAMQVKEVKAKRDDVVTGSCGGSSDVCMSSSWGGGSCLKPENGGGQSKERGQRVDLVNLSRESIICRNPSNVGSPPTKLHKLKSQLSGLVQKELSSEHAKSSKDEGDEVGYESWKHLRDEAFSGFSMVPVVTCSSSKLGVCVPPAAALQLLKSRDGSSGAGCFAAMYTNEAPDQKSSEEEHTPALQTCSDSEASGSDGGMLAENGSGEGGGGPSSNSSACGNLPERNGHSGSSEGSSDVEAPSNVPSNFRGETNEQSSSEAEMVETKANEAQVGFRCFSHEDFTSSRKDSEKHHPQERTFRLLPRSLSSEGEQQKEATLGRSQVAFQALFARETLPRTFSPPPRDSLATCRALTHDSGFVNQQALSLCLQSRISHSKPLSSVSSPADEGRPCHPHTTCVADQDSAFNAWQPYKASKGVGIRIDKCEGSSITTSSGAQVLQQHPEEHQSPKRTKDIKRKERYGEGAMTINWLTLGTESSSGLELVKEDSEDTTDFNSQHESLHMETSTPHVDFFPQLKKKKFIASSNKVDDVGGGSSLLTMLPLSCSEPSSGKTQTHMFSLSIATTTSGSGLSTVSSTRSVKYSGLGFVPYQRASLESSLKL